MIFPYSRSLLTRQVGKTGQIGFLRLRTCDRMLFLAGSEVWSSQSLLPDTGENEANISMRASLTGDAQSDLFFYSFPGRDCLKAYRG